MIFINAFKLIQLQKLKLLQKTNHFINYVNEITYELT